MDLTRLDQREINVHCIWTIGGGGGGSIYGIILLHVEDLDTTKIVCGRI